MRAISSSCRTAGIVLGVLLLVGLTTPSAWADLVGSVPTPPGSTVFPGLVPPGTDPGTLLAALTAPFVSSLGTDAGTIVSAVFRESGGTLDFYYQITNNMTAPNCGAVGQQPCDALSRGTATNFFGFITNTGFRLDGSSLPGGLFVDGTVPPVTADRNSSGDVVGFNFNLSDATKIQPGQTSTVLVISTDATAFTAGNFSAIDGGVMTVASFEPRSSPVTTPEPTSLLLLGSGLLGVGFVGSVRKRRRQ